MLEPPRELVRRDVGEPLERLGERLARRPHLRARTRAGAGCGGAARRCSRAGSRGRRRAASAPGPSGESCPHRLADDRRVADLARPAGARADPLLGREELLALLLDEHAPEQRAEQPDVPPQRAVGLLSDGSLVMGASSRRPCSWRQPELCFRCPEPASVDSGPRFMLPDDRSRSRTERRAGPTRPTSSLPPAPSGRRELARLLVAAERMWLVRARQSSPGSSRITLFSARATATALGYHWHSFDNVLLGVGRLTAFLAGYLALIEVFLLARLPFLERLRRLRPADRLAPLERPRRHLPRARARRLHRLGLREAGRRELVPGVLELADAAAAEGAGLDLGSDGGRLGRPSLSIDLGARRPRRTRGSSPRRSARSCSSSCSSPRSSSCGASSRTSGGTRSTSPRTPGSRSPGST